MSMIPKKPGPGPDPAWKPIFGKIKPNCGNDRPYQRSTPAMVRIKHPFPEVAFAASTQGLIYPDADHDLSRLQQALD
jgi:hypothetical protein